MDSVTDDDDTPAHDQDAAEPVQHQLALDAIAEDELAHAAPAVRETEPVGELTATYTPEIEMMSGGDGQLGFYLCG